MNIRVISNRRMAMTNSTTTENTLVNEEKLLSCEICLNTVPPSEADSVEGQEYVAYYFGLECYEFWVQQKDLDIE